MHILSILSAVTWVPGNLSPHSMPDFLVQVGLGSKRPDYFVLRWGC